MTDQGHARTFKASAADRRAGRRPWYVLGVAAVPLIVAVYFLGWLVAAVVAVLTLLVAVPLALRHARAEDAGEVDVTADAVVSRRGDTVLGTVDRRSPSYDVVTFSDAHELTTQVLVTDGTQHVRLVSGSWSPATIEAVARAASASPRTLSWKDVKAEHPGAFPLWERRTGALIAAVLIGVPVLVIAGSVLAVLLFDVG